MNPDTIARVCEMAGKHVAEGYGPLATLFLIANFLFFMGTIHFCNKAIDRTDAKVRDAGEGVRKMLEEHRACSALMVSALKNPRANVTINLTVPEVDLSSIETRQPTRDVQ